MALILLGGLVSVSGDVFWKRSKGYSLEILFADARGLGTGSYVFVSGVQAGKVTRLDLASGGVSVFVSLPQNVRIPRDSRFIIASGGLLGESEIHVHRGFSPEMFNSGDRAFGELPPSFDQILSRVEEDLQEIRSTFKHVNDVLTSPGVKENLQTAFKDLPGLVAKARDASERISTAGESFRQWADTGKAETARIGDRISGVADSVEQVIGENRTPLNETLRNLSATTKRLESFMAEFDTDGQAGKELRSTLATISRAAQELELLLTETRQAFTSEGTGDNPVKKLREVVDKADRVLGNIEKLEMEGRLALRQVTSDGNDDRLMDLSLTLGKRGSRWSIETGVEDLGGDELFNALIGWDWTDWLSLQGGVVRGDLGGGFEVDLRDLTGMPVSTSWLWWDDNGGEWKADAVVELEKNWGILYRHLHGEDDRKDSIGLFYQF